MANIIESRVTLEDEVFEETIDTAEEPIEVVRPASYNDLQDLPQINGVTLQGNKTSSDLGIVTQNDINSAVSAEATLRENADTALGGRIDNEKTARENADTALGGRIDGEITNRTNADNALGTRIDNEILARQGGDNNLQTQIDAITSKSDVVDVVADYAALQAYDTQHLGDNDVIKVLDDETHGDALTYYRWSKTNQTWTFIGQEAPYYSKSQTDTLLLGKQNTIDSSHKLSADLVDDSSTTNKFVTASDITNWNGKQNTLTAGSNIQISGSTISATDTKYSAGNGITLTGTQFSANTSVLATKNDLGSYYTKTEVNQSQEEQDAITSQKPYYFDSIAEMKTYDLEAGACAFTTGYYFQNDGGGAHYTVVDDSTLVDDGGSVHELENGLRAVLTFGSSVNVKQFGAVGDGVTDDFDMLQSAIEFARNNSLALIFPKATYLIASSLTIYSNMIIDGCGATLKGSFNGALITSSVIANVEIKNMVFLGAGNSEYTNNFALSIVPYYSNFHDLNFRSLYKGINLRIDGASGTLVENRIDTCKFTNCNQALYLGETNNNKLTDGILRNVIINSSDETKPAIEIGSGSGWIIDGVHIYGYCNRGLLVRNGYHTLISNMYIERAGNALVSVLAVQTDINLNNITGTLKSANNIGIELSRSSYYPYGSAVVANLNNIHLNVWEGATSSVGISGTSAKLNISNYSYLSNSSSFTPVSTNNTNTLSYQPDTYIAKGKLTDRTNSLSYRSSLVSIAYKARVEAGGDKTITIPIDKKLDSYDIIRFKVAILTKANWNGTIRINYTATVILANKNNAKSVTVLEENGTSGGFTTTPTYTYDPDAGALTLSYTPSSSDGYGCVFVDIA